MEQAIAVFEKKYLAPNNLTRDEFEYTFAESSRPHRYSQQLFNALYISGHRRTMIMYEDSNLEFMPSGYTDTCMQFLKRLGKRLRRRKKITELKDKVRALRNENTALRAENAELRLLPDAPDYLAAKTHYEGLQ